MDNSGVNNSVYKTASMGISSLKQIIPDVKNHELKNLLGKQYAGYCRQADIISKKMKEENQSPKPVPKAAELMAKMGTAMNIMQDNSTSNIAKMLVKGTNMGIIEINTAINHASDCSPETIKSAKEYLKNEQAYLDSLKSFL